jgi:hypothetical protein
VDPLPPHLSLDAVIAMNACVQYSAAPPCKKLTL